MNKHGMLALACAGVLALSAAGVAVAETIWVSAGQVDVRDGKTALNERVDTVKKGDQLEVLAREGRFVKVKTPSGKEGYVFVNATSNQRVGGEAFAALRGPVDAGEAQSGGAIKGLNPEANAYAAEKGIDRKGFDDLIDMRKNLKPAELQAFMDEGKVGPR
jgi:hypothetical protein